MRTLYLLRHAKASWADPNWSDIDRPLNERGRHDATELRDYLRRSGARPQLVVCSPALRTRQTLDLIAPGLELPAPVTVDERLYAASAQSLWQRVRELPDTIEQVMLIGHNPGMHDLAANAAEHGDDQLRSRLRAKLPTCAFVTIAWDEDGWDALGSSGESNGAGGTLHDFVTPRDLR